jgi:hippurate hydrolase
VTIAAINAGSAHNVIPDRVTMKGTMRTLSAVHRQAVREALELLVAGIAGAHELTAILTVTEGFPVTVCDGRAVDFGERVSRSLFGEQAFRRLPDPIMGAEDFAYVLEKVPGAMFFIGFAHANDDWSQCCGIHSTRMMLDEAMLPEGAALLARLGEDFLAGGFDGTGQE